VNPVDILASKIQKLPSTIRWFYNQQDVIIALANGRIPERGWRTKILDPIVQFAHCIGLATILLIFVNASLLFVLWVRQFYQKIHSIEGMALFAGMGTMREPELRRQFGEETGKSTHFVDEHDIEAFMRMSRVKLIDLFLTLRDFWRESWPGESFLPLQDEFPCHFVSVYILKHGHRYFFFQTLFNSLSKQGRICESGFVNASYIAHAASFSEISKFYFIHGFLRYSIIFPDFNQVHCFNVIEAEHMRRRLPNARVKTNQPYYCPLETECLAAVAGAYWYRDGSDKSGTFIHWALETGMAVVIRPHPNDRTAYWSDWRYQPRVTIVDSNERIEEFLRNYRPRFLVAGYSTALFDAIVKGVVPVTLAGDDMYSRDMVFPFREIALQWPSDVERIEQIKDDEKARGTYLDRCVERLNLARMKADSF
jgi:hypothetical protein